MQNLQFLKNGLRQIVQEGGSSFMIIKLSKDYYIQFAANDTTDLLCEAVSNVFLPKESQLNINQENLLLELGWETPEPGIGNFARTMPASNEEELEKLARWVVQTAQLVYQVQSFGVSDLEIVFQ